MKLSKGEIALRLQNSSRNNCINWRGAVLRTGDNVIYKAKHHGKSHVGLLLDISDQGCIPKGELATVESRGKTPRTRMVLVRMRCEIDRRSTRRPDPMEYCHVGDSMKELVESYDCEWVPATSVINICFIFHIDSIQKGLFSCQGMKSVFFIRFLKSRNGRLIPIAEKDWHSFYRDPQFPFEESYPERIWTQLMSLKMEVQKTLSRGGEWNGRTASAKLIGVPSSFYGYVKDEINERVQDPVPHGFLRNSRCRKVMFDNLSASNVRSKVENSILRVVDENHLDAVRGVFGTTFGVGCCIPVPSMKMIRDNPCLKATVWLRNMDPIRIVSCINEENDMEPGKAKPIAVSSSEICENGKRMKLLSSYRGLDLRYSVGRNSVPELSVQCRFVKLRGDSVAVSKLHGRVNYESESESVSSNLQVEIGDYLNVDGKKAYVVQEICTDGTVRCVSPSFPENDPIVLTVAEANQYLMLSIK